MHGQLASSYLDGSPLHNHPLNTIIIIITTTTTMIIIVLKTSAAFKVLSMCVRLSLLQLRPLFACKEKHETYNENMKDRKRGYANFLTATPRHTGARGNRCREYEGVENNAGAT